MIQKRPKRSKMRAGGERFESGFENLARNREELSLNSMSRRTRKKKKGGLTVNRGKIGKGVSGLHWRKKQIKKPKPIQAQRKGAMPYNKGRSVAASRSPNGPYPWGGKSSHETYRLK